ncbi:MAG TPA: hypothetical protein VKZ63_11215, partial [Kofleriaceae bacterium]|nr:hypothetical protein [Kofleriaceae bacterium]
AACAGAGGDADVGAPTLLAASKSEVSVGQALEFIGQGYLTGKEGHTELHFEGEYVTEDGQTYAVEHRIRPHWGSGSRLVWANVGPFEVPFSPTGNELGTFIGTVTGVNVDLDGNEAWGEPLPMDLRIGPSVIVRDLQPVTAACEQPAKRLLGGFPYRITVEAVGIEPVNFTYQLLNEPGLEGRPRVFRQPAEGQVANFGDNGELFLPEVPQGQVFYIAELLITARDAEGRQASNIYAFGVHRPVEYVDWGNPQIAQIEAPQPVSGCIAGGINGQMVRYTETETQSRSRQVSYHWDENWVTEHSGQYSTSHEERNGVSINYSRNEEYGWSAEWNRSDSFSGGGGISINPLGFIGGSVSAEYGVTHSYGESVHGSVSTGYTVGHDYSTADTESWAFTNSESYGVTKGGGEFWEVSSSTSISSEIAGDIIPSMYGVWYRQVTRIVRPGSIIVYNMCGQPQVVAEAQFEDYTWAVSLAQAAECPPLPKPTLPEAQCVIAPCNSGGN